MNTDILLIEDEETMRCLTATALELEGFTVHQAADGAAGIEAARHHRPDLILCDVMMPGIDGYQVLATLRADPALCHIPFIFLTAKGEKNDLRQGMVSGADDYLTKPVASTICWKPSAPASPAMPSAPANNPTFPAPPRCAPSAFHGKGIRSPALGRPRQKQRRSRPHPRYLRSHREKASGNIFGKLGVEKRGAASLIALEALVA
jgi:CheY-like chemotaxis protein